VSDWEGANKDDFLVLGPSASLEAWRGDEPSSGSAKGPAKPATEIMPELNTSLVGGVLEQMLREVLFEDRFVEILDQALTQDTPYFLQYEDSLPPGDPDSQLEQLFAGDDLGLGGAVDSMDPELKALLAKRSDGGETGFQSNLLMDFEQPMCTGSDSSGAAASSVAKAAATDGAKPADGAEATGSMAQKYWEEAQANYGEVDLETFKNAAGEVLDRMLLDMIDDVVAGRLNWMRPIPRAKQHR
jgi:hypothetical protein